MTVTQALRKPGSWGFKLSAGTPRDVLDRIDRFGHIAISMGRVDCRVDGDGLLRSARYVGVVRSVKKADERSGATSSLGGAGMEIWLGDGKTGSVFENATVFSSGGWVSTIQALLPASGAVVEGTIHPVIGVYSGQHQWQDPRTAIDYVCDTFTTDADDPVDWRVNGDGTLDAGYASDLFVTDPVCLVVRRDEGGVDMTRRGLGGTAALTADTEDFATRAVVLASGNGRSVATGAADLAPGLNPYKDVHGNAVAITKLVSESRTEAIAAGARAQLALDQSSTPHTALTLSTSEYDVRGSVSVGDWLYAYNPHVGLVGADGDPEIVFRGQRLRPQRLRLVEMTWPVAEGMSVAYRDGDGGWVDLTEYVQWENGSTTLVVGDTTRLLSAVGEQVGSRPVADTSVPAAPTFVLPFRQAVYQSAASGVTKAQVQVEWTKPANTDGTLVLDGDRYEIQYRTGSTPIWPSTHGQMSAYTHGQLAAGTHAQPITYQAGPWQSAWTQWDDTDQLLQELTPGVPYDIRIRAYDQANPANVSAWSATTTVQTVGDTIAPATPAPPSVAASRIAVQITHELGRSDGGTYNLDADLHHLEIHAQYAPSFFPDESTRIGKLLATNGMMLAGIPAVGTFPVEFTDDVYIKVIAVDEAGNQSSPSEAAQSSVLLIDDAHISDLTVTKVTAGTINAAWILAGSIKTGTTGARMEADADGLRLYNASNVETVNLDADTGNAEITGMFQSGTSGRRVVINPGATTVPEIWFYPTTSATRHAYINSLGTDDEVWLGMNSGPTADSGGNQTTLVLAPTFGIVEYNAEGMAGGPLGSRRGGWMLVNDFESYLGWTDDSTGTDWYHRIDSAGSHTFRGRFGKTATLGSRSALHVDQVSGSGTSMSYSYGTTYVTTPLPFIEIQGTSGSPPTASSHAVTARSATGFSIQYPAGNCDVFVWAIRYG
ncbi:fibronectin type III domain-containing protein [Actinosynnema sp. NPDC051121]